MLALAMINKKRVAYHHGSLRATLILKALELLAEFGGAHFTMRDLATQLGVSHSAAYRHFKDKDALLAAIAVDGFQKLAESQRETLQAHRRPLERLKQLGLGYIAFALSHPAHFRVMFRAMEKEDSLREAVAKASSGTFEIVVQETKACQAAGKIRKGESLPMAQILWASVHGMAMLSIDLQLDRPSEALANQLAQTVLRGLKN